MFLPRKNAIYFKLKSFQMWWIKSWQFPEENNTKQSIIGIITPPGWTCQHLPSLRSIIKGNMHKWCFLHINFNNESIWQGFWNYFWVVEKTSKIMQTKNGDGLIITFDVIKAQSFKKLMIKSHIHKFNSDLKYWFFAQNGQLFTFKCTESDICMSGDKYFSLWKAN